MDFTVNIKDHTLEYIDTGHIYLVDGIIRPSITEILSVKYGQKYQHVNKATLQRARDAGTAVHKQIEDYCKEGIVSEGKEMHNFLFLKSKYGFEIIESETPVILFENGEPFACGRLDLVLYMEDKIIGADIKTTSVLDKGYLAYQLNLYRIAYQQSYGVWWDRLAGVHLKGDKRKLVRIPIMEGLAWEITEEYKRSRE